MGRRLGTAAALYRTLTPTPTLTLTPARTLIPTPTATPNPISIPNPNPNQAHPLRAPQFWALLGHVLIVLQLAPDADEELDGAGAGGDAPMTVADAVAKAVAGVAGDGAGECASSQEEGQGADRWRVRQETRQQFKATVTERAAQVEEMDAALRAAEEELRGARRDVDELTSQMSAQQLALERTAMHYSLPGEESEYHKLQVALEASTKAHAGVAAEHRRVVYLSEDAQRAARRELISQLLEAGGHPAGEERSRG